MPIQLIDLIAAHRLEARRTPSPPFEVTPQMAVTAGNHVRFKVDQALIDATGNQSPQTLNSNSPMVVVDTDDETGLVVVRRESTMLGAIPYQYLEVVPTPPEEPLVIPPEFILE